MTSVVAMNVPFALRCSPKALQDIGVPLIKKVIAIGADDDLINFLIFSQRLPDGESGSGFSSSRRHLQNPSLVLEKPVKGSLLMGPKLRFVKLLVVFGLVKTRFTPSENLNRGIEFL